MLSVSPSHPFIPSCSGLLLTYLLTFVIAFAMRNATDEFVVHFQDFWGTKLRYYAYEPTTGCFKIHLSGNDRRRIYVKIKKG